MRAEAWWASRGGSSDGKNAREGGKGGRGVRREGTPRNEGCCKWAMETDWYACFLVFLFVCVLLMFLSVYV